MPWGGDDEPGMADDGPGQTDGPGATSNGDGSDAAGLDTDDTAATADAGETMDPDDAGETTGGDDPPPADVPDIPYCDEVADWDRGWSQLELDILAAVNVVRGQGANCGSAGNFGATGPLTMHPALRCAARKHSLDMHERAFFDHVNPSGEAPWDRMEQAGYGYTAAGENIAGGSPDAAGTMDQWMNSDGHCSNIMNPDYEHIGVGYYPGGQWGTLWTQVFGAQ